MSWAKEKYIQSQDCFALFVTDSQFFYENTNQQPREELTEWLESCFLDSLEQGQVQTVSLNYACSVFPLFRP